MFLRTTFSKIGKLKYLHNVLCNSELSFISFLLVS
jgi:hypothetical protein